jgi:hypothetical protein
VLLCSKAPLLVSAGRARSRSTCFSTLSYVSALQGGPKISLYILVIKEDFCPPPVADAMPDLNLVNIGTRESLTV